ncbi:MAG TPA: hypothetical protein VES88_01580 [Gemmatimonadaceae bacterium]|nr:hypothetical protein [Gemmatimonadaceae bacterium]
MTATGTASRINALRTRAARNRPPQILGLADGGGVGEGMHPRLDVPRRHLAGYARGHHEPEQAGEHRDARDDEGRVQEEIGVKRVSEKGSSYEEDSNCEQGREVEPGRETAYLVGELEAKDFPELHDFACGSGCSRRRPM